jgi:N-acetylmuramoyl-L-alanine amidase
MKFIKKHILVSHYYIILAGLFLFTPVIAQDARFTVVLDAGHGGHDPGAMSSNSREKDINLAVVLDLGSIIEQKFKDVKVVYTRKTDKYLTLQERADVVNDHHADLFICIHTNASLSPAAYGAETFTLGLAKTKSNLDVAMRENSVILLEEDYRTKYKGFDPKSIDSYIMFEFMQDKYIDRSVEFSSIIQKQFVNYCQRTDRGVRQAGFWVLHRSACPSVLVELGFITNQPEERYLTSERGQKEMATAIFNAFVDYKRAHDKKSGHQISSVSKIEQKIKDREPVVKQSDTPVVTVQKHDIDTILKQNKNKTPVITPKQLTQTPVFKVQLFVSTKNTKPKTVEFKGVKDTEYFEENGLNKYTVGMDSDYSKIVKIRKEIIRKFPNAFIIAFVGDKKIPVREALKLIK